MDFRLEVKLTDTLSVPMSSSEDNGFETGDNNRLPGIAATTDFDEDHGLHPRESNKAGRVDQSNGVVIIQAAFQDGIELRMVYPPLAMDMGGNSHCRSPDYVKATPYPRGAACRC